MEYYIVALMYTYVQLCTSLKNASVAMNFGINNGTICMDLESV